MAVVHTYHEPIPAEPAEAALTIADGSHIQLVAGLLRVDYYGQFLYDSLGNLSSGVLRGIEWHDAGGLQMRIEQLDVPFESYLLILYEQGEANAMAWLLSTNDSVYGTANDDYLAGYGGNDLVDAGAGNDTIDAAGYYYDIDTLIGGDGDDIYIVGDGDELHESPPGVIVESPGGGIDTVYSWGNYVMPDGIENVTLLYTAQWWETGRFYAHGNALGNYIIGNERANVLEGRAGNDTLYGGGGEDTLRGGVGDDTYIVDWQYTQIEELPGEGRDTVASTIPYTLADQFEDLRLTGTSAINGTGNASANSLHGNDAANRLDGAGGADTMEGGGGDDTFVVDSWNDVVTDSSGFDLIETSLDGMTLNAPGVEGIVLTGDAISATGNAGNNYLRGNALANSLAGGLGNDTLDGGAGIDTMIGGAGDDTLVIDSLDDVTVELAGGGRDTLVTSVTATIRDNFEVLQLAGPYAIDGTGSSRNDSLVGNDQANRLDGLAGNDTMEGGEGGDTYVVDSLTDVVVETGQFGKDAIESAVNFDLAWTPTIENVTLTGSANLTARGNTLANLLVGNAGNNVLTAVGADSAIGGAGNDTLVGEGGVNWLDGGEGADVMIGGDGDDLLYVDNLGDVVVEQPGGGRDGVNARISLTMPANIEMLFLVGGAGAINATGSANGNEVLQGNESANVLHSGGGNGDHLFGMDGDDSLHDDGGVATLEGGIGSDLYYLTNPLSKIVDGDSLGTAITTFDYALAYFDIPNIVLLAGTNATGNPWANRLTGNAGNNVLDGGGGIDTLEGAAGNDRYFVDSPLDVVIELAGGGNDTVEARGTDYSLAGTAVEALYFGDDRADNVDGAGNELANVLRGTYGMNVLDGGAGIDELVGLGGDDTYIVDDTADVVVEAPGEGRDLVRSSAASYTLPNNVEDLRLEGASVTGIGNALANVIDGNALSNVLQGGGGNDRLWGGLGADSLTGGAGNNTLDGDAGVDTALYSGAQSAYTVTRNVSTVIVSGPEGVDVLTGIDVLHFADGNVILNPHQMAGFVSVTGAALETSTLTAHAIELADPDGFSGLATWQWFRDGRAIEGATGDSYVLTELDVGHELQARVRQTDGLGNVESIWSAPTSPVTGWDKTPPHLLSTNVPEGGQATPDQVFTLTFDGPVQRGTGWIVLRQAGEVVEVFDAATSNRLTFAGSTVSVDPGVSLAPGTNFTLAFPGSSITDAAGNPHYLYSPQSPGSGMYFLTTQATVQPLTPFIQIWQPLNPHYDTAFDIEFAGSPIQAGDGIIVLRTEAGQVVATYNVDGGAVTFDGNELTLPVTGGLQSGLRYFVDLPAGAVIDGMGHANAAKSLLAFTTEAALVEGTAAAEVVTATPVIDEIRAYEGNDTIESVSKGDTVYGGSGVDTLVLDVPRHDLIELDWGHALMPESLVHFQSIERIQVDDALLALDTFEGDAAWQAQALLWAALGAAPTNSLWSQWVAEADHAGGLAALAQELLDTYAPGVGAATIVAYLFTTVAHITPTAQDIASFTGLIGEGNVFATLADLVAVVAAHPVNTDRIPHFTGTIQVLDESWFM